MAPSYVIMGYKDCFWCSRAEKILENRKIEFKRFIVPKEHWKLCVQELKKIVNIRNHKTSPIIFHDGKLVGGYLSLVSSLSHVNLNLNAINNLFNNQNQL